MNDADLAHKLQIAAFRRQSRLAMRKAGQLVPENTVSGNALTCGKFDQFSIYPSFYPMGLGNNPLHATSGVCR